MKRRNVAVAVVAIIGVTATVFFLPLIPLQVYPFCIPCPGGGLPILEQGHASVTTYFTGYGGIYMSALDNNGTVYVGYCVVYGSPSSTSCGVGVTLIKSPADWNFT